MQILFCGRHHPEFSLKQARLEHSRRHSQVRVADDLCPVKASCTAVWVSSPKCYATSLAAKGESWTSSKDRRNRSGFLQDSDLQGAIALVTSATAQTLKPGQCFYPASCAGPPLHLSACQAFNTCQARSLCRSSAAFNCFWPAMPFHQQLMLTYAKVQPYVLQANLNSWSSTRTTITALTQALCAHLHISGPLMLSDGCNGVLWTVQHASDSFCSCVMHEEVICWPGGKAQDSCKASYVVCTTFNAAPMQIGPSTSAATDTGTVPQQQPNPETAAAPSAIPAPAQNAPITGSKRKAASQPKPARATPKPKMACVPKPQQQQQRDPRKAGPAPSSSKPAAQAHGQQPPLVPGATLLSSELPAPVPPSPKKKASSSKAPKATSPGSCALTTHRSSTKSKGKPGPAASRPAANKGAMQARQACMAQLDSSLRQGATPSSRSQKTQAGSGAGKPAGATTERAGERANAQADAPSSQCSAPHMPGWPGITHRAWACAVTKGCRSAWYVACCNVSDLTSRVSHPRTYVEI